MGSNGAKNDSKGTVSNNKSNSKQVKSLQEKKVTQCETCEFYDYDEFYMEYTCDMKLDQDEMLDFVHGNASHCPYYRYYDEYKSVAKQN